MSTNSHGFLPLEPHLEEQLNDIDEYIRAESQCKAVGTHRWRRGTLAPCTGFTNDRTVPDETQPDFEEAGNYLDELTLHEELLDYLDMLNPPGRHFQVQFWNLKDVYEKKARKTFRGPSYKFEDSVVMIEATSSRDLSSLRVYVQRCPEAAMKTHDTLGPIKLETDMKQRGPNKTIFTVELDSVYAGNRVEEVYWLEKAEVETRNKWELLVIAQFADGMKAVTKSRPFRISSKASGRKSREQGSNEKDHSTQQSHHYAHFDWLDDQYCSHANPTDAQNHLDTSQETAMESSCFEQAATQLQLELAHLQMNQDPTSPLSSPWEPTPTSPEPLCAGRVILKPKSPLNREKVTSRYSRDPRIEYVMEQSDLPGLVKMVSSTSGVTGLRRRANGHKSAEEDFWWACGFCFFERRKKSTVKAHVIQRVCRKPVSRKETRMRRHLSCDTINETFDAFSWKNSLSV